jgi:hypothetical protein
MGTGALEPTKKDLMISKIISRAACLTELTSNPKSFSNCPDLHGGVPGLPGGSRPKGTARITRSGFGRIRARQQHSSNSPCNSGLALSGFRGWLEAFRWNLGNVRKLVYFLLAALLLAAQRAFISWDSFRLPAGVSPPFLFLDL